jgi:hypothetical protein
VILLLGMWPHAYLHRLFAEDSLCGRVVARNLAPVYDELSVKYPILRMHTQDEGSFIKDEEGMEETTPSSEEQPPEEQQSFIQDEPSQQ